MALIHDNNEFNSIKPQIVERIRLLRNVYDIAFDKYDHDKQIMKGSRWADDNDIFYTFCGNLIEKLSKEKRVFKLSKKETLNEINKMNQQDIDCYVLDAIIERGTIDYFYRYND
jgi:hypothetical protein